MGNSRLQNQTLFFRQLHTMFAAGICLPDCVEHIEKGSTDPQFSLALRECSKQLSNGSALSQALGKKPGLFDPLFLRLVKVGERAGSLVRSLEQIAVLGEKQLSRRQHLGAALAYPICLLLVMFGVCAIFVVFVSPGDSGLGELLGEEMPWPSRVLMVTSSFLSNPLVLVVGLFALVFFGLLVRRVLQTRSAFRENCDGIIRNVPIIGRLDTNLDSARVLDVVATCLQVGLDLVSSLKYSLDMCRNQRSRFELKEAIQAVEHGQTVAEALASKTHFPRLAVCLIDAGEVSGALQEMMAKTSQMISEEVDHQIEIALDLVEPLLLSVGGVIAGFVAIAAFLPVMQLVVKFS